jgi:hypothetical protein
MQESTASLPTEQVATEGPLTEFIRRFTDFLPDLAAGLVVIGIGVVIGWLVKRLVVRVLVWLRLDRLGGRYAWRAAFGKGDVRAALYNLIGSAAMVLVVLIFLDDAFQIWGLTALSDVIGRLIIHVPNLLFVALIVGIGVLVSNTLSRRVEDALEEEEFVHPRFIARIFKSALLAIVGALALWQLNFAREIVLAAFLIAFGAIGVAFAVAVGLGSAKPIQRVWESLFERSKD